MHAICENLLLSVIRSMQIVIIVLLVYIITFYSYADCVSNRFICEPGQAVDTLNGPCSSTDPSHYKLVDLGAQNDTYSLALGINDSGNVVGVVATTSPDGAKVPHAILWRHGIRTELGPSGQSHSYAYAINNQGQIAGYQAVGTTDAAVMWKHSKPQPLSAGKGQYGHAYALNNRGELAGVADYGGRYGHACLWQNGPQIDLGTLDGSTSCVCGLNDQGEAVGYALQKYKGVDFYCYAVIWQHG